MGNSGGISASLAGRYATALFALASENKTVAAVETSLGKITAALCESADLQSLTINPLFSRDSAKSAVAALAKSLKLDVLTSNALGVMAHNRRLSEIGAMARAFHSLAANERGEISAQVISAHALTAAQNKSLAASLKKRVGSDVIINAKVDPDILGGLVITIGSQMIDSSLKTRLNSLATAMKG